MTEREQIIEAIARAIQDERYGRKISLPQFILNLLHSEATAALDAALPLVLPEEPSLSIANWDGQSRSHQQAMRYAFAARRKELSDG